MESKLTPFQLFQLASGRDSLNTYGVHRYLQQYEIQGVDELSSAGGGGGGRRFHRFHHKISYNLMLATQSPRAPFWRLYPKGELGNSPPAHGGSWDMQIDPESARIRTRSMVATATVHFPVHTLHTSTAKITVGSVRHFSDGKGQGVSSPFPSSYLDGWFWDWRP